jgi:hypothetical protein
VARWAAVAAHAAGIQIGCGAFRADDGDSFGGGAAAGEPRCGDRLAEPDDGTGATICHRSAAHAQASAKLSSLFAT